MTGAMYAAIAGLKTHMQNLNVIGNNVANVNTAGYKSARAVFKTSIYTTLSGGSNGTQTIGGVNPSQIGYGANIGTIDIDMTSGNYSVTGKSTDMMIDGDGFFLVGSKDIAMNFTGGAGDVGTSGVFTSLTLTRVGDFDIMPDGYLAKDMDGNVAYGFMCTGIATDEDVANGKANKVGDPMFSDQLVPLRVPRVYRDKDGAVHVGYARAGGGYDSTDVDKPDGGKDSSTDGVFTGTPDTKHILDYGATFTPAANGAPASVSESTASKAEFTNITVDQNTGIITGVCSDLGDQVVTIGCIAVGHVTNPNGVTQIGNSYYKAQQGAGELTISAMGGAGSQMKINYVNGSLLSENGMTNMAANDEDAIDGARLRSSKGQILNNGLEMSKTDLAQEIANMIVTQRGYQANTRIITVTDSMLEELVNMKR